MFCARYQALTALSLPSVPKPIACGSRVCVTVCMCDCVSLVSLYLTQLFWECRGPPWVGNDVRAREWWERGVRGGAMEADICCGIPEFRLHSVFGTQLSGIWLILPPFLLILPLRPQCSRLSLKRCLSRLFEYMFVALRNLQTPTFCCHLLFNF